LLLVADCKLQNCALLSDAAVPATNVAGRHLYCC